VLKDGRVSGIFEIGDPNFGNLWTNIPLSLFFDAGFAYGDHLNLTIRQGENVVFKEKVLFQKSFGFASKGDVIIYNNELMRISLAVNQGSFSKKYNISYGPEWQVEFSSR
jgi:S-adenosylmethionine hydrolase